MWQLVELCKPCQTVQLPLLLGQGSVCDISTCGDRRYFERGRHRWTQSPTFLRPMCERRWYARKFLSACPCSTTITDIYYHHFYRGKGQKHFVLAGL